MGGRFPIVWTGKPPPKLSTTLSHFIRITDICSPIPRDSTHLTPFRCFVRTAHVKIDIDAYDNINGVMKGLYSQRSLLFH